VPGDIARTNRDFYDKLWRRARLQRPERFNTWPLVRDLLPRLPARLELGPGLRPRLPIAGTRFVDISAPAVTRLRAHGGLATVGCLDALPFPDASTDLVCAMDVIEHVEDDRRVLREIRRVLAPGGVLLCSVPLHPDRWTAFDDLVGHARRYEPAALTALLAAHGFRVEKSATFGMQPSNPRWVRYGQWWLEHHHAWAIFWYNWVGMPFAMLVQPRLHLSDGLIDTIAVDEVVIVCRHAGESL
jgi:SAM-dependent methyltransferase